MKTSNFDIPIYDIPVSEIDPARLLGNNAKQMIVLVGQEDFETNKLLLEKILAAVKYDLAEDAVTIQLQGDERIASSRLDIPVRHMLIFGINPRDLGLSVSLKKRLIRLETITIVRAPSLGTIASNTDEKRKLWEILKSLFLQ